MKRELSKLGETSKLGELSELSELGEPVELDELDEQSNSKPRNLKKILYTKHSILPCGYM